MFDSRNSQIQQKSQIQQNQQRNGESVASVGGTMTRQDEWEIPETEKSRWAASTVSLPTGRHKRNTRSRGEYNGFTKSAVVKLTEKKRGYVYTQAEKDAMTAYFEERCANAGLSMSAGTPDHLVYVDKLPRRAADTEEPNGKIPCGSIECRPEKWIYEGVTR